MRIVGPILVIIFSILILGSEFLPYAEGFGGDESFWKLTSGADIALAVACILALGCALGALFITVGPLRALAALFGGLGSGHRALLRPSPVFRRRAPRRGQAGDPRPFGTFDRGLAGHRAAGRGRYDIPLNDRQSLFGRGLG